MSGDTNPSMLRALVYLRVTSFQNWIRARARRLRQPKYLAGTLVGAAYFYFFFFRRLGASHPLPARAVAAGMTMPLALPAQWLAAALAVGATALLVLLTFMWVFPTQRPSLGFTEAEIAFLFPAPVARRSLVHFRLLSSQLRSLSGGLIMAVITNRWSALGGNAVTHAFGWWFIFSMLNLHLSGVGFTLGRLADRGFNVAARRALVPGLVLAAMLVTYWRIPEAARAPGSAASEEQSLSAWLIGVTSIAPLSWLLFPLRLTLGPFLAPDARAFLIALGPALGVIALHYWWVVGTVISFEDAAIESAHKRAARLAAWRSGERRMGRAPTAGRRPSFALADSGRPEIAFIWKNLLSTWPYFTPRAFGWCALGILAATAWLRSRPDFAALAAAVGLIALIAGGYVVLIGPQFARQDVRADLAKLDILKTYPLPGWQIVLGELLTPAAILTGIVWLALLAAALNFDVKALGALPAGFRAMGGLGVALLAPAVIMIQLLVPNAAAIVFPAWFDAAKGRGGGIDVMGQRMIFLFAQILTFLVAIIPPAAVGTGLFLVAGLVTPSLMAVELGILGALIVLLGEVAAGVWWLGRQFERIDVSVELR